MVPFTRTVDTKIRDIYISLFLFQQQSPNLLCSSLVGVRSSLYAFRSKRLLSKLRQYCRPDTGSSSYVMVVSLSLASGLKRPGFLLWIAVLQPTVHIVTLGEIGISPNTSGFAFHYRSINAVCSFGCRLLDGHCLIRGPSST
jgi:hypothetical protein